MDYSTLKIAYFGGEPLGVPILNKLHNSGIVPNLIVCNPDRPTGRKQILTAPPVKQWATEHTIDILQPETLTEEELAPLTNTHWDLFIVVAYNKIMPTWLINLPKHKTINVHPSLLPLLRGASPIRSALLQDMRTTGVTIMLMDEKMDHGPILAQERITIDEKQWPVSGEVLDAQLSELGGILLIQTVPEWIAGSITPKEQKHEEATYCGRLDRSMGKLDLDPENLPYGETAYETLLRIKAFDGYPGTFFMHQEKRIKIIDAHLSKDGQLEILRVIPEGKKECSYTHYLSSLKN